VFAAVFIGASFGLVVFYGSRSFDSLRKKLDEITQKSEATAQELNGRIKSSEAVLSRYKLIVLRRIEHSNNEVAMWRRSFERIASQALESPRQAKTLLSHILKSVRGSETFKDLDLLEIKDSELLKLFEQMKTRE